MFSLIRLNSLWSQKMSKLLKAGYNTADIAKLETLFNTIKLCNKQDLASVIKAEDSFTLMYNIISNRLKISDFRIFMQEVVRYFDFKFSQCRWGSGSYPLELLVALPDERGSICRASMLFKADFEWQYDAEFNIIRATRLWDNKDVLSYTTDPLKYLKFQCLPNEKLQFNNIYDEDINADYSGVAPVFLGIELEVEKRKTCPPKIEHLVAKDLGIDYMILKSDSSIQNGFEIVTCPATIGFHLTKWDKFFDPKEGSSKHLTSWTSGRCGMHVHISRGAFTPMHMGKFFTFINSAENREFITSIGGRNSHFSAFNDDKGFPNKSKVISKLDELFKKLKKSTTQKESINIETEIAQVKKLMYKHIGGAEGLINNMVHMNHDERHSAVNLAKKGTVELRIFKGNIMKVGMLKNLEFTHAAVEFTREATFRTHALTASEIEERKLKRKENTDYTLHYTYFLDWLSKDDTGYYNNLKQWLQTHKLTDKFAKKKLSSKAPLDKIITDDDIRACA